MRVPPRATPVLLAVLLSAAASARGSAESSGVYRALRAARPAGKTTTVTNLLLERDAFRFRFESGSFQMLSPVEGRVVGAVFTGEGSVEISPSSSAEARHFAMLSGDTGPPPFTDRFQSAVLLFSDATAAEIESHGVPGPESPAGAKVWDDFFQKQRRTLRSNLQLRLLQDVLAPAPPAQGVFLAAFSGRRIPSCLAAFDPEGLDWMAPFAQLGGEEAGLYVMDEPNDGFWYLGHARGEPRPARGRVRVTHYVVDTTILRNSEIRGKTSIRFTPLVAGLRVLPLSIAPKLRISEAALSCGDDPAYVPAAVIQEISGEDSDAAAVFAFAPEAGQPCALRLTYEGRDVLQNAGDGVFVVRARESWYPNLGSFTEPTTFDLTYRVPKANQVISVGTLTEERVEGDLRVVVWRSDEPIRVAGFNYGKFKKLDFLDKESGVRIDVFTNPGTPDAVAEINQYLAAAGSARSGAPGSPLPADLNSPFTAIGAAPGLREILVDTETLAKSALADGMNTARVCTAYFGKLPQDHVSITEQTQWSFGQSWPSLVFLPYLAFLDGTTRHELGLKDTASFVEQVGLHEFAHQWWGHLVGWGSYRDQWLSEGFAEFTAGLVLEFTGGLRKASQFWEQERRWIVAKPPPAVLANDAAGPMTQGFRLATRRNRNAYAAMVYAKGAYVLHMLRMTMRDPASKNPDEAFRAMMQDFVRSNSGKSPTTRDFQAAVERHMTPALNATHDGKLDWFFQQWVYGSDIPRFKVALDLVKGQGDKYRLKGSVAQEGVPAGFRSLLPIYIEFGKGELVRFGTVPLIGNQSIPLDVELTLARKPKRAFANALHEVLNRD